MVLVNIFCQGRKIWYYVDSPIEKGVTNGVALDGAVVCAVMGNMAAL